MNRTLLFVTTFPPRECGIATFTQDLVNALHKSFAGKLKVKICALGEAGKPLQPLQAPVVYNLDPYDADNCIAMAHRINADEEIDLVCFEHEFGLYGGEYGHNLLGLLSLLDKPFIVRFHTVLPNPDKKCLKVVSLIGALASKVIVMTQASADILRTVYHLPADKTIHIPHGTHAHIVDDVAMLKKRYGLQNKLVLSTFGLLSENKGLETGITAMRDIVKEFPNAVYLILGKTHPTIFGRDGEKYRQRLEQMVAAYGLQDNVRFVNNYLSLADLLDYLSLTDIYLFTSIDPHQAVSGTFVYAMSAGCPIISTAFVQAREMLDDSCGRLIEFNSPGQLAKNALELLGNPALRMQMSLNAIEKTRSSLWDNVAIAHMSLFNELRAEENLLLPNLPPAYLDHIDYMTDEFGMLQFSKYDVPDPAFGYTLDDNARALIAMCMYADNVTGTSFVYSLCRKYIDFIDYCQQPNGRFLNYVDINGHFTTQNHEVNLEDSNGRAVWALGYILHMQDRLPALLVQHAERLMKPCMAWLEELTSPRAMSFAIKGIYYYLKYKPGGKMENILQKLAARLFNTYTQEADSEWKWFESYITYGNAVLPEAMMMAHMVTGNPDYRQAALDSLEFLCSKTFTGRYMKAINNRTWYHKAGNQPVGVDEGGEQSIEVAYTMLTMDTFSQATGETAYMEKMRLAFSWYLGNNHLKQLVYNPLTFGCYDGLEKNSVNQNQGAESSVCYLIARLLMEQWNKHKHVTTNKNGREQPARLSIN